MRSSRAVLSLCMRCASLEPMALPSTPCEQSAKPQPSTASCMLVRHGGVKLTKQIGPRLLKDGFTSTADTDIDASISSAQLKLLNRVQSNEFHVLRPLFPPLAQQKY